MEWVAKIALVWKITAGRQMSGDLSAQNDDVITFTVS